MRVADVMTTDVVTVGPDATYGEIVDRLLAHEISGVPVVDDSGRLLGIVTEADLVSREAYGPARRPLGLLLEHLRNRDPACVRKASGATARELMTSVVTTAATTTPTGHHSVDGSADRTARQGTWRDGVDGHRHVAKVRVASLADMRDLLARQRDSITSRLGVNAGGAWCCSSGVRHR